MRRRRIPLPASIILPPRWRRHTGVLLGALALTVLVVLERLVLSPAGSAPESVQPDSLDPGDLARYHDRSFSVVHIVDGDTLDIGIPDPGNGKQKTRIRLWGVDCPEIAHGGNKTMHFGPQATNFAKEKLGGRDVQIVLSPKQTRDKFGRLLAYVFLDRGGPMFNEMLLEEGFAYADPRFNHYYETRFTAAERRARDAQSGLWKAVKIADMPKWRQKREKTTSADMVYPPAGDQ